MNYIILFLIIIVFVWVAKTFLAVRDLKNKLGQLNEQRTDSKSTNELPK